MLKLIATAKCALFLLLNFNQKEVKNKGSARLHSKHCLVWWFQLPTDWQTKSTSPGSKTVSRAISSENLKPAFINSFPRRSGTFNQGKKCWKTTQGAVQKWRHSNMRMFWPPSPLFHTKYLLIHFVKNCKSLLTPRCF